MASFVEIGGMIKKGLGHQVVEDALLGALLGALGGVGLVARVGLVVPVLKYQHLLADSVDGQVVRNPTEICAVDRSSSKRC